MDLHFSIRYIFFNKWLRGKLLLHLTTIQGICISHYTYYTHYAHFRGITFYVRGHIMGGNTKGLVRLQVLIFTQWAEFLLLSGKQYNGSSFFRLLVTVEMKYLWWHMHVQSGMHNESRRREVAIPQRRNTVQNLPKATIFIMRQMPVSLFLSSNVS